MGRLTHRYGPDGRAVPTEFDIGPIAGIQDDDIWAGFDALVNRLAAYEDICFGEDGKERITIEELTALVKARDEGRVVVLPERAIAARYDVADMLQDDLKESAFSDPSVGIFGLTWAEGELWQAIIDGLNQGRAEAEAALNPCEHCASGTYRGCDGCGYNPAEKEEAALGGGGDG